MELSITYAELAGVRNFQYRQAHLAEDREIVIVSKSESISDQILMWLAFLGGNALALFAGGVILLGDRRLRRSAPAPTVKVLSVED